MGLRAWFRRREMPPVVSGRSDLTVTSGRYFSPYAPWNQLLEPCGPRNVALTSHLGTLEPPVLHQGPEIRHVVDGGQESYLTDREGLDGFAVARGVRLPVPMFPSEELIVVDHQARTVLSASNWVKDVPGSGWVAEGIECVPLDGDGWGSSAVGLLLERDLLTRQIDHAVGMFAPADFYGARLRLREERRYRDPLADRIARALCEYGGIVVGIADQLTVRIERSPALGLYDRVGPTYRALGMGDDPWPLPFKAGQFDVLT